ncbi:cupredoxin domain-containing protein [uncultured Roseobacter sp.]|uniref:cupredoxin domain-containing protein n=1 Tax=uncultured Roseobacter sp. TaxID=114847 RepID=UPI0026108777|nr:cupredoxin domain-containing protein [uncultured Roseobacter sp.]
MERLHSRRNVLVGAVVSATALAFTRKGAHAQEPGIHVVQITKFAFVPDRLEVSVGDTIRWTNQDLAPHTATAGGFGWDSSEIVNGSSAEIVVTEGMETSYFCVFHPHMRATLEISGNREPR